MGDLHLIIDQYNLYTQQFIANNPTSYYACPYKWKQLTVEEFKIILALKFNMGLTKNMNYTLTGSPTPSITCFLFHPLCQEQNM